MTEKKIMQEIQIEISRLGGRVFRNQTGKYKVGDRWISSGLCVGSSDLIGWYPIRGIAVFLAIEVKTSTGRASDVQNHFIQKVRDAGGIAFIARSVGEAKEKLKPYCMGAM